MDGRRILRTAGFALVALGAATAIGALVVRDQMSRHRRDLFSPHPLRRLAALGYLAGREATVDAVQLLRDFIAWEQRPILRRRATSILERFEEELVERQATASEEALG
ncbi:MAG: hypothetical protein ACOC8B_08670 [Gemmatimonadota bacterium]